MVVLNETYNIIVLISCYNKLYIFNNIRLKRFDIIFLQKCPSQGILYFLLY